MTNHHHKGSSKQNFPASAEAILGAIDAFLSICRRPAALERGEEVVPLTPGEFTVEVRNGYVFAEFSTGNRTIGRKIISIDRQATGILECTIERFARKEGKLTFFDLQRAQATGQTRRGARENFSERFRRMLCRQFPGWEITTLTCGADLQRSFSPVFPRAHLRRGSHTMAAMACAHPQEESAVLTFALLWHHYLLGDGRSAAKVPLCLFLPETAGNLTSQRLRWLTGTNLAVRLFRFNAHGSAGEVDARDLGNLQTRVSTSAVNEISSGVHDGPERLLETQVRSAIQNIDASLQPRPVHGQVLAFSAGDRDLIDLLAVSHAGRLTVVELKASEDIHLPLQALDYWTRIAWHATQRELDHLFPGIPVSSDPPRLLLLAPAMSFHSANATVLRYFSPDIEVERIGINEGWRQAIQVVFRLGGASSPISHGVWNEHSRSSKH